MLIISSWTNSMKFQNLIILRFLLRKKGPQPEVYDLKRPISQLSSDFS